MLKAGQKNDYREFLKKKRKFAEQIRLGKKFKDTDKDGLSDYEEKNIYGTNPKNPDTDGDGMKDGSEVKRRRNPLGSGKLKDLFIPHAGNNYSPQALKPRRLLFHAISIIAMKAVVVVFVLFYPLSAWLSPDLALAETKKIIELTNSLRQAVSSPALSENRQLTQAAWQKVEDMAFNQYFAHISPTGFGLKNWLEKIGYKYAVAGENLAVGFSKAEDVVLAWKNSPAHYSNIIDSDFEEIGVAMADGKLNQIDTAFIAQYFGAPASQPKQPINRTYKNLEAAPVPAKPKPSESRPASETEVKGLNITEAATAPVASAIAQNTNKIAVDQKTTTLSIKSDQFNEDKVIQIKTTLPADTVSAQVVINSKKINLTKESSQTNEWSGASLIGQTEEENILNPLIPASITLENSAGTVAYGKIDWDEIKIIKTTLLEHYQLFKNYPAMAMKPIMNLSGLYFKLVLIIAIIAMLLNIFVQVRKQRPHVIFYSFAFLGLLLAMIIF